MVPSAIRISRRTIWEVWISCGYLPSTRPASSGASTRNSPVDSDRGSSRSLTTTAAISRYGSIQPRESHQEGAPVAVRSSTACCNRVSSGSSFAEVPCTIGRPGTRRTVTIANPCLGIQLERAIGRMRTLVTGGAGFIGSALVDRLVHDGNDVVVIDDLSTGRLENLADAFTSGRVQFAEVDVAGPELAGVVSRAAPEVVHHLAAQIDVRRSVAEPALDARVNVLGTIQVARAALDAGCRRLVFASSGGTVYGEPDPGDLPIDERYPPRVTNPYGVSKRAAEDYLSSFADLYGLEPVSLRLGNVYGPRQDPGGEAGVVAIFCNRLLSDQPVTVFGDGLQTRDYVFVDDVVDAFVAAGQREGIVDARLNIGTGIGSSVLDLYGALRSVTGFGPEPTFAPPRPGELRAIALACGQAERVLGWRPKFDLAGGLERTWAWAFQEVNAG